MNKQSICDEHQVDVINYHIGNLRAFNGKDLSHPTDCDMKNCYDENEYFLFQIVLHEYEPIKDYTKIKTREPISPHAILYSILSGDTSAYQKLYIENRDKITLKTLGNIVTANINKRCWYFNNELVATYKIKTFARLTLTDMNDMVKCIPIPEICFHGVIQQPKDFVDIVNKTNPLYLFDFIPYLQPQTKLKRDLVYRLAEKINWLDINCNHNPKI